MLTSMLTLMIVTLMMRLVMISVMRKVITMVLRGDEAGKDNHEAQFLGGDLDPSGSSRGWFLKCRRTIDCFAVIVDIWFAHIFGKCLSHPVSEVNRR